MHIQVLGLRLKLNSLKETCISSKSMVQRTKIIFSDSAIFTEKKIMGCPVSRVEKRRVQLSGRIGCGYGTEGGDRCGTSIMAP